MTIAMLVLIQTAYLLVLAVYLIMKSSFFMLERKNIFLFMPVALVGLEVCFEAALLYFRIPLSGLPGKIHDVFLIFLLIFYIGIFWRSSRGN